jgi:hypothetical protein
MPRNFDVAYPATWLMMNRLLASIVHSVSPA